MKRNFFEKSGSRQEDRNAVGSLAERNLVCRLGEGKRNGINVGPKIGMQKQIRSATAFNGLLTQDEKAELKG